MCSGALSPCSVCSASIMQAVADTESGTDAFSTIITNAAQYQLNDVRSIKKDSFEVLSYARSLKNTKM